MTPSSTTPNTAGKVRYGFVALGDIAQEAMLPGVDHTGNSVVTALVTSDPEKARQIAEKYGVGSTYAYEQFDELLQSGTIDALYIATPNWRHAEFIIPALKAGIHVLVEKPLEISVAKSREIQQVARESSAKFMVAYRLHFEPATLALLDRIRGGELGDVNLFTSTFVQMVDPANHRAKSGDRAGPVFDMGPYPINAARYVFSAEPEEVFAAGARYPDSGLGDFDHAVAVTLRFPGNRLAQFTVSYYGNTLESYFAVGTKGSVHMQPCYMYGKSLEQAITIGTDESTASYPNTDHFGGELKYFSQCVLDGTPPEPDVEEGIIDVQIIEGIMTSLKSGTPQKLGIPQRVRRIDTKAQKVELPAQPTPELVNTSNPGKGTDKVPKN